MQGICNDIPKQTMFLGYVVLQLFCIRSLCNFAREICFVLLHYHFPQCVCSVQPSVAVFVCSMQPSVAVFVVPSFLALPIRCSGAVWRFHLLIFLLLSLFCIPNALYSYCKVLIIRSFSVCLLIIIIIIIIIIILQQYMKVALRIDSMWQV
jgi:hypothetical protein